MKWFCAFVILSIVVSAKPIGKCMNPQCGGFIGGVMWIGESTNCSFVQVNLESSAAHTLAHLTCCQDHHSSPSTATPITTYDNGNKALLFTTGDGAYVYGVNVQTGLEKPIALMPSSYSTVIGLNTMLQSDYSTWNLYLTTTTTLYQIIGLSSLLPSPASPSTPHTAPSSSALPSFVPLFDLTQFGFGVDAEIAVWNYTVYVKEKLTLWEIALPSSSSSYSAAPVHQAAVPSFKKIDLSSCQNGLLATAVTLQYWVQGHQLLTFVGTDAYAINPLTGACTLQMKLPSTAKPPIQSTTIFGDMFFVVDGVNMFETNIRAGQVDGIVSLAGDGTLAGAIQYYY